MAGIAPLGGSPTTNQPDGTAATVPGTIAPNTTPPPQKTPDTGPSFTAFPSSYEGFGSDGNGFGTLSVVHGQLSIVQTPPAPPASTPAAVAQTDDIKAAVPSAPSGSQTPGAPAAGTTGAAAATPPPPPPPPAPPPSPPPQAAQQVTVGGPTLTQEQDEIYTAIPPPQSANQQQTPAPPQNDANQPGSLNANANSDTAAPGSPAASTQGPPPGSPPAPGKTDSLNGNGNGNGNSGSTPGSGTSQTQNPPPPTGLLGTGGPPPFPGGTAVENNPALGLLGAPATNPIVIQAEKQQAAASEAAAAADDAAAADKAAAQIQLEQINARIAAARAANNQGAVEQLQPTAVKLTGEIQGQTFPGLGETPPKPFATPAIPPIFLNIAS